MPWPLFLACLPGVLLGSICGPHIARLLGPQTIMVVFAFFLLADVTKSVLGFADVFDDSCNAQCVDVDPSSGQMQ